MRLPLFLALVVLVSACAPQPVRTDRVRIFEVAGKPETEWGYDPKLIEVSAGTTVNFTSTGTVAHTVTADDPSRPFDVSVEPGKDAAIRFLQAGTWAYHCGIHPAMKGTVRVCDGACP